MTKDQSGGRKKTHPLIYLVAGVVAVFVFIYLQSGEEKAGSAPETVAVVEQPAKSSYEAEKDRIFSAISAVYPQDTQAGPYEITFYKFTNQTVKISLVYQRYILSEEAAEQMSRSVAYLSAHALSGSAVNPDALNIYAEASYYKLSAGGKRLNQIWGVAKYDSKTDDTVWLPGETLEKVDASQLYKLTH